MSEQRACGTVRIGDCKDLPIHQANGENKDAYQNSQTVCFHVRKLQKERNLIMYSAPEKAMCGLQLKVREMSKGSETGNLKKESDEQKLQNNALVCNNVCFNETK